MSTFELPLTSSSVQNGEPTSWLAALRWRDGDAPFWTKAAPRKVVRHFDARKNGKPWLAWSEYLARKQEYKRVEQFCDCRMAEALLWGVSDDLVDRELSSALSLLTVSSGYVDAALTQLIDDLSNHDAQPLDEPSALGRLAIAYALPALAASIGEESWWKLLAHLHQLALDSAAIDLSARPLAHQWLAGELPLVLACLLPEIAPCGELLPAALRAISVGFEELLDGEGMPHARHLSIQPALAACWTRAKVLAQVRGDTCWNDDADEQYPLVVRQLLRVARRDGRPLFSETCMQNRPSRPDACFFRAAVKVSANKQNDFALRCSGLTGSRRKQTRRERKLPSAAFRSEWGHVAVLRSRWSRFSPHLGIAFGGRAMRGELVLGRYAIFTADWRFTSFIDDRPAMPMSNWEEVCWVSDDDVDYLELEIELSEGIRLQRQICLAREDRFLFVADAVLGGEPRTIRHTLHLPLGSGIETKGTSDTREVALNGRRRCGMVMPLALPEWRIDPRGGEFVVNDSALELRQGADGRCLYSPLWIDLDPGRHKKSFTWRQLTVAEERQTVPRDAAVGYRLQFGKRQWLVYRSLTPARNRTVLGHNLSSEFLIARFGRDGSVNSLIEVE